MICTSDHMEYNLFDKYRASKDIKLQILLYLTENEIHYLMGSISKDWNNICNSTFNNPQFTHKFESVFNTIIKSMSKKKKMKERFGFGRKKSSNPNLKPIGVESKILIECPWDRLWTYGTITRLTKDKKKIIVTVPITIFDPFMDSSK